MLALLLLHLAAALLGTVALTVILPPELLIALLLEHAPMLLVALTLLVLRLLALLLNLAALLLSLLTQLLAHAAELVPRTLALALIGSSLRENEGARFLRRRRRRKAGRQERGHGGAERQDYLQSLHCLLRLLPVLPGA
ncbi:hypothetical protein N177_4129 [Lutibaculum baratangense AMV1]|uniref:Uncharacterized protein n=1 Tax=Lutibaculum baratangense AMV1 TaxID=631454 RepID=V4RAJ8_9HYPH|nr:hypothetical protein N177_4129 [Lutibaculum baratangense AMV1]